MLATLVDKAFDSKDWLFEIKWDGYRALAVADGKKTSVLSRNNHSFNELFPTIIAELKRQNIHAILDGEIVLLDENGKSQFQLMQNYQRTQKGALRYFVFDLLFENGEDLRDFPLIERKKRLQTLMDSMDSALIRSSEYIIGDGIRMFKEAVRLDLEGIIGKRMASLYVSSRSKEWVKIKTHLSQEAVICGFTAPRGSRKKFGALLLGVYNNGRLNYIGHTGGAFSEQTLGDVYRKLTPLIQSSCPFEKVPKTNSPATWIKPKLVCAISFNEWTAEGIARQPIFQGLREDKKAEEVTKEIMLEPEKQPNHVETTNIDKIYWPKEKYTKGDLINYYESVATYLLPYLKDRPVMIRRFPNGIEGDSFYQKDSSKLHLPAAMKTVTVEHEEKPVQYLVIQNKEALKYAINLGAIELHPFLSRIKYLENPDFLVIDLDPEAISFEKVMETALEVHELLDSFKIDNYCKTSGGDGLHIFIPLHAKYTYEQSKRFGELLAALVHSRIPDFTSLERKPEKRQKKVYLDVYQNNFGQTVVAPYTVRGRPFAPVSTPILWKEVKQGLSPTDFTIETVPERLNRLGDIFKPVFGKAVNLLKVIKKIEQGNI